MICTTASSSARGRPACPPRSFWLATFAVGCRLDEECGLLWVDETQQTSVRGVYAAGDITPHSQLAVVAAAEGAMAAIHIHQSLIPAERQI